MKIKIGNNYPTTQKLVFSRDQYQDLFFIFINDLMIKKRKKEIKLFAYVNILKETKDKVILVRY